MTFFNVQTKNIYIPTYAFKTSTRNTDYRFVEIQLLSTYLVSSQMTMTFLETVIPNNADREQSLPKLHLNEPCLGWENLYVCILFFKM